jgi:hypothetical protein
VWQRLPDLEQRVTEQLAAVGGEPVWQVFTALHDMPHRIAAGADSRLAFRLSYPTCG